MYARILYCTAQKDMCVAVAYFVATSEVQQGEEEEERSPFLVAAPSNLQLIILAPRPYEEMAGEREIPRMAGQYGRQRRCEEEAEKKCHHYVDSKKGGERDKKPLDGQTFLCVTTHHGRK